MRLFYAAMAIDGLYNLLCSGVTRNENFSDLIDRYTDKVHHYLLTGDYQFNGVDANDFREAGRTYSNFVADGKPDDEASRIFFGMVDRVNTHTRQLIAHMEDTNA